VEPTSSLVAQRKSSGEAVEDVMSQSLLTTRRFAPLFWCQFFSAFNDNFLKNALVLLILFKIGGPSGESLVTLAGGIFIAPFFLLSAFGGQLADRFDKALVARRLKLIEIGAAAVAVAGFQLTSVPLLFLALFLFGVIGALFGPIKYGILPDHLQRQELPSANALVEGATFLAILGGTIAGGLAMQGGGNPAVLGVAMMLFALLCWSTSLFIPKTAQAAPGLAIDPNILGSTTRLLGELWSQTRLWRCAVVTSTFWLVGAIVLSLLPPLVMHTLGGTETVVTIHLAVFAVAIGVGSGLASWLSAGRIILWPAAVGALLIGLFSVDLGFALLRLPAADTMTALAPSVFFARPVAWRAAIDLGLLAVAGGLMIVPSFAAIQAWAAPERRARIVAAVNVLNAAFMVGGALTVALLQNAGVGIPVLFLSIAAVGLLAALWIGKTMPTAASLRSIT
jgi:acyl-[acyl-carrier-protein]-phospholipid O-acyltransferase / long-chain-fatty-acid--[acyl-carrier-protein] ligase